mmetsp:Transcript_53947/g.156729  ORF Transcript_53947/g.156729 Transcript_53947/m.156729 type:complete len:253 (-) Transcript_53947:714-1472(-)
MATGLGAHALAPSVDFLESLFELQRFCAGAPAEAPDRPGAMAPGAGALSLVGRKADIDMQGVGAPVATRQRAAEPEQVAGLGIEIAGEDDGFAGAHRFCHGLSDALELACPHLPGEPICLCAVARGRHQVGCDDPELVAARAMAQADEGEVPPVGVAHERTHIYFVVTFRPRVPHLLKVKVPSRRRPQSFVGAQCVDQRRVLRLAIAHIQCEDRPTPEDAETHNGLPIPKRVLEQNVVVALRRHRLGESQLA